MRVSFPLGVLSSCFGALLVAGCPVDERSLQGITISVGDAGTGGDDFAGGAAGAGGDTGGAAGGDAGATSGSGGKAGGATGGASGGGGATGGSGGKGASGSGGSSTSGVGGGGGAAGGAGTCGCGEPLHCPDIDGNRVADCDETLAENSSFDADVRNWANDTGVVASWGTVDAHDSEESGSLSLETETVIEQDGSIMLGTRQCFPASGGAVYRYAVEVSVPEAVEGVRGGFQLIVYSSPACNGEAVDSVMSSFIQGSAWSLATLSYLAPTSAKSIAMRLVSVKPFREDPVRVRFDNVLVHTE